MQEFKLCYVRDNILYFTDNFEHQSGDDWDDAPYEHNADEPYVWDERYDESSNAHHGNIRMIAYYSQWDIKQPCDNYEYNSPYSVDEINKGKQVAWLYHLPSKSGLYAGTTIEDAIHWLRDKKIKCGELV